MLSTGNENGEILMTVLTQGEGSNLQQMADGLVERYSKAKKPAPDYLYVDKDCCGHNSQSAMNKLFKKWPNLKVSTRRDDIFNFHVLVIVIIHNACL